MGSIEVVEAVYNSAAGSDPEKGAHAGKQSHGKYASTLAHERRHLEIAKNWWDRFKREVDILEQEWCSERCRDIAANIYIHAAGTYEGEAAIEDGEFDKWAYGGGEESIKYGNKLVGEHSKKLQESWDAFIKNNCWDELCPD